MIKANSIQLLGDLIISLIGYLYWDWNIYFILLFMLLDVIARSVLLEFKVRKLAKHSGLKSSFIAFISNFLLVIVLISTAHIALYFLQSNIDLYKEFIRFLTVKEMGIPQGALLIPLIGFMVYAEYNFQFVRLELYKIQQISTLRKQHTQDIIASIILSGSYLLMGVFFQIKEVYLVYSLLGIVLLYRIIQPKIHNI